jgi:ABC-type branched-subunit amino acid transport system substrate-binding protein
VSAEEIGRAVRNNTFRSRGARARAIAASIAAIALLAVACGGTAEEPAAEEPAAEEPATEEPVGLDGPVRIGVAADLTGPFTIYGTSMARSAQIAVDEINAAGGIGGQQVELIIEDTQTDVTVTVDKARKLIESDGVQMVLGPIGSDANDAVFQTVVGEYGVLQIYPETYEGGKCDPLFFSTGATPAQQIRPLLDRMQGEYGPKVLLFGADYVWPRRSFEVAKPIIEEIGGELVGEVYLPLVAEDYSELITQVRDSQPDYIFTLYPAVWGAALKALEDAGLLTDELGLGTTFLGDPDLAGIGALARNNYTALPFFTVAPGDGVAGFLAAYEETFGAGEIPSGGESMGSYNAIHLYKQAVEAVGTTDPATVAEALRGQSFDGPTGTVTMNASNHLEQTIMLVKVNDAGVYEFVEAFDARDPEEACSF